MEGIERHLGFPSFPGFLFLLGNDGPLNPPELRQVQQRPPTSLEKCTFTKNNYQSKEQGHLAWCNSFHLSSDLAIFTINLISLWYLPKKQSAETGSDLRYSLTFRMQQPKMQRLSGGLQEVVTYSVQESNHIGPLPRRGPGTSTLWKIIYCMQFPSYTGHV